MTPDAITNPDTTRAWLNQLYSQFTDGWLTLFAIDRTTGERHTRWHRTTDLDALTTDAHHLATTSCVWFGVATRTERLIGKRGGAEHCHQVPALWVDLDVAGPVHHQTGLPPDTDAALLVLDTFPLEPTAIVHSGHGLQAWWLLDEPTPATDVANMLDQWRTTWDRCAHPWHVDNVFDLPRIMRLPGTTNHKADPQPVTILANHPDRRYALTDIVEQLDPAPTPSTPAAGPDTRWTGDEGLPGQVFNHTVTGHQVLTRLGFVEHHRDHEGTHYTRPGKDTRHGSSATVYTDDGHTTIWSDTVATDWPAVEVRRPYDPFGLYAAFWHRGDFHTAAAELERQGYGTLAPGELDLDDLIAPSTPTEPEPPQLLAIRWTDTYLTDPPPVEDPIIEGLLNAGEFMVVGAERGIGKTWLGYNIASLLATGAGPLFDRLPIPQKRNVLYLQGELDETQAAVRWKMLHHVDELTPDAGLPHIAETFDPVRFRVVRRRQTVKGQEATISDEYLDANIDQALEATIVALDIEVVIVDPWAVFLQGNENSNDEVEAVLSKLREIGMRNRVAWIIFHHLGKARDYAEAEDTWRGASRLADWAANRVTIVRHYTDKKAAELGMERRDARRFADLKFLRRGAPIDDFSVHLEPDGWWRHWTPDDDEFDYTDNQTLLLNTLAEAPGQTFQSNRHAADLTGLSSNTARDNLHILYRLGKVRHAKHGQADVWTLDATLEDDQ